MMNDHDRGILRDLAKQYTELCVQPVQDERRALWRQHNSLKKTRPLIYVRAFAWREMPESEAFCENPLARQYEDFFRRHLFWDTFDDDSIFEPWVTIQASRVCSGWGMAGQKHFGDEPGGSFKVDYPIKDLSDIEKLRLPWHEIDETATAENVAQLSDVIGDIITINVDRGPAYRMWTGDISTDLGYLRGIEHFMLDMLDHPDGLHRLVKFMSYGFDQSRIRSILKRDLEACRDGHLDITLKDVETVENDPARVKNWVALARDVIEDVF